MLIILLFTTTSNATLLFYKQRIYDRLQENSAFQKITDIISNITSNNDEIVNDIDNNTLGSTEEGKTLNDEPIPNENLENKITLQRIIEIIIQNNEKFGIMLQRILIYN